MEKIFQRKQIPDLSEAGMSLAHLITVYSLSPEMDRIFLFVLPVKKFGNKNDKCPAWVPVNSFAFRRNINGYTQNPKYLVLLPDGRQVAYRVFYYNKL